MQLLPIKKFICFVLMILFVALIIDPSWSGNTSSETAKVDARWAEQVALDMVSKIRKGHPRIFLTPERISGLRTQALSSKKHIFDLMKEKNGRVLRRPSFMHWVRVRRLACPSHVGITVGWLLTP